MKKVLLTITENVFLTKDVCKMTLQGDVSEIKNPGEFVNIKLDGLYLRRPVSVFDKDEKTVSIVYKIVGKGTGKMSVMNEGDMLDVLTGLGNGYDIDKSGNTPLLIGGGVGIPPLFFLAKELTKRNKQVKAILGFNTKSEIFLKSDFEKIGVDTIVTTVDGSFGTKGFVTDAIRSGYSYFYTCGPEPMLKAVFKATDTSGQFSFEERMGCGFGACMGCSCKTVTGYKRICKEGPVIFKEEILWEK